MFKPCLNHANHVEQLVETTVWVILEPVGAVLEQPWVLFGASLWVLGSSWEPLGWFHAGANGYLFARAKSSVRWRAFENLFG